MELKIKVDWFDELNGIGEGTSSSGELVFLKSSTIVPNGHFATLKPGEAITCEVAINEKHNNLFSTKIIRHIEPPKDVERSTFLEPQEIEEPEETTI